MPFGDEAEFLTGPCAAVGVVAALFCHPRANGSIRPDLWKGDDFGEDFSDMEDDDLAEKDEDLDSEQSLASMRKHVWSETASKKRSYK